MVSRSNKSSVLSSAGAMSMGTMGSRILGYLRDVLLYAFFPHLARDAFIVAFQLPNLFRRVLGEGSLAVSFIPVYVEKNEEEAQKLANALMSFLWVIASLVCTLGIVFMDQLLPLAVSGEGYARVAGKVDLTVSLAQIMFAYLFFVTTYAYYMAILNALGEFFIPALAPAAFNITLIAATLWAGLAQSPKVLAWGVVVGGFFQVSLVFWSLYKKSKLPRWTLRWRTPGFVLVLQNMAPGIIGVGVSQLMTLANLYFASQLGQGTHSYLYLGQRILELPHSLISISLGSALLPTLAKLWREKNSTKVLDTVSYHLQFLLFLVIPSAVGMYILALPMIEVLFLRGEFGVSDVLVTASVIQVLSFLLVASSLNKVMVSALYAIKNTWYPAVVSLFCLILHMVLAHFWTPQFGIQGLVASMTFSGFCNVAGVFLGLWYFVGPLSWGSILRNQWKTFVSAGCMGLSLVWVQDIFSFLSPSSPVLGSVELSLPLLVLVGGGVYFLTAHVLKSRECAEITVFFGHLLNKVKCKKKKKSP